MATTKRIIAKKVAVFIAIFLGEFAFAASTFTVCDTACDFSDLYLAMEKVNHGDTVEVLNSQVLKSPLGIGKSIQLIGKNRPELDGKGKSKMLIVLASDVEISGFIIKDSLVSYLEDISGIRVESASGVYIHDNILINNAYGIYLAKSKNCRIENNQVIGIDRGDTESGNGIHIWSGKGHQIIGNKTLKNRDGIYFEFVSDSKIESNDSFSNSRYGLHFMFSHRNEYRHNRFSKNSAGVAVMYSKSIVMDSNDFSDSVGGGAYGLLLKDISLSQIFNNHFHDNSVGIFIEGTTSSKFSNNIFKKNTRAIRIFGNSDGNKFLENTFIENTFEVATNSSASQNFFDKNYWGKYDGYDLNSDNFGDVPHRPVSVSSVLTEKINSSFIFVYSPLFYLLDIIENALPSMGPENLFDKNPRITVPAETR